MRFHDTRGKASGLILACVIVAVAGCAGSTPPPINSAKRGMPEDIGGVTEEKKFAEIDAELPPYPQESDLLEFQPRRNSVNHFYVDRNSISIGADRVIRYSAVVKSPSGAMNVSHEGLRCKTSEYKVYAYGLTSNEWTKSHNAQWRKVPRMTGDFRFALYKDYFCDIEAIAGRNEKELIANLSGNPLDNMTHKNR